ncbi:RNA-directed DNA polymerase [Tateyamaria sp. SN3-11]|uniref:RNA-directed DNA polymerase n=1 Tax=Tateyamaria sp. SN3-11 TaxID=3092147 RepID=UPI0039EB4E64
MPNFQEIAAAVNQAIDHVIEHGLDDIAKPPIFMRSIEHQVIEANAESFRTEAYRTTLSFLRTRNLTNSPIGNPYYYMVPKDEHTLRRVAWIDPFDVVKYLSVALLLAPQIETQRPSKQDNVVHSHRRPDTPGTVFDGDFGYDSFRQASGELSRARIGEWKVVTDISNFFDRIGNHPLENHLGDCGCDREIADLAREILFQWSGDRRSFGVPVGSDASRILSEAALIAVDRELQRNSVTYVRYVDDYRLFAETRAEAYDAVRLLSELLAQEGLTLNNRKTRIFQIQSIAELPDTTALNVGDEHERIDESARELVQRRVQVSGRTSISRFYRYPGAEALRRLRTLQVGAVVAAVQNTQGAEQEEAIRTATKYFVYVRQDVEILEAVLRAKITSVFYIVDALVKDEERIHPNVKEMVRDVLLSEMGVESCPYPFQMPLIRLCAANGYEDNTLANAVINRQRNLDNQHFFREAILLGFQQLERHTIRRLAMEVFPTVSPPIQRAIAFSVKNFSRMNDQEKRPLVRNIEQISNDWFVRRF